MGSDLGSRTVLPHRAKTLVNEGTLVLAPHTFRTCLGGSRSLRRIALAVVLHVSGYDLPVLSVPSMHMTAIRASPIAVPSLACMSRTCLERGVAALAET